jgi:hypothetical protein
MAKGKDKNYVSFWFWFFALFVMALPCIGFVMIIVWAFLGENESRKNYFRASLVWALLFVMIWGGIMVLGFWPVIQKQFQAWVHHV